MRFEFTHCFVILQVKVFKQPNYLENFVQATFNALTTEKVKGKDLSYLSLIVVQVKVDDCKFHLRKSIC